MSYQLEMERSGKVPQIEMPPLPEDVQAQQQSLQQQVQVRPNPAPKRQANEQVYESANGSNKTYDVHPDIASEFTQINEIESHVQPVQEPTQEESVEEVLSTEPKQESFQAKNFRQLKEQKEQIQRERDEMFRRIQEMEAARSKPVQQKVEEKEEEYDIQDDDLVEARHLKKYNKQLRELKEELKTYRDQTHLTTVDSRLKSRYPDLDTIVTRENLNTLRESYPELADSINANNDLYNKAASAYTLIKKLGIAKEDIYVEDRQKAQKNVNKPRPMASISPQQGESPLSHANAFANGLTSDLKARLRKEMDDARRNM